MTGDTKTTTPRLEWIDAIKGIGILLIMIVHMGAIKMDLPYLVMGYVAIFFVASGLTFNPNRSFQYGMKQKAHRLLTPYFFYMILIVIITEIVAMIIGKETCWGTYLLGVIYSRHSIVLNPTDASEILMKGGTAPLWFLTALFVSYLLVYVWSALKRSKWILTAYLVLAFSFNALPILLPWSLDVAPLGALLIIAGYKLKLLFVHRWTLWFFIPVLLLYALLVHINGSANMSIRKYGDAGMLSIPLFFIVGMMECWLFAVLFQNSKFFTRILAYIGRQSLRLMCIHLFIWISVKDLVLPKIDESWHSLIAVIVIGLILLANHLVNIWLRLFPAPRQHMELIG